MGVPCWAPGSPGGGQSGTYGYVTLRGKGDFAAGVPFGILRQPDGPGLSGWAWCHPTGPYQRKAGESELEKERSE